MHVGVLANCRDYVFLVQKKDHENLVALFLTCDVRIS